jgi:hypothetical protein
VPPAALGDEPEPEDRCTNGNPNGNLDGPFWTPDFPSNSKEQARTGNSFVAETLVLMADGSHKPIEDVKIGDKVIATDPTTGTTTTRIVTDTIIGNGEKNLVQITVDTDGKHGNQTGVITATDGHPFWTGGHLNKWVKAKELKPGMWLRTSAGTYVQISAIKTWTQHRQVYNLTVDTTHTYYVEAGTTPVLVHNCDIALGIQEEGNLAQFAADRDLTTFTHLGRDEALAAVREVAMENPQTKIHVTMDGFKPAPAFKGEPTPADLFEAAYNNGKGGRWWTTEREMAIIGDAVRRGRRTWDSITFYQNGKVVNFPQPSYLGG